MAIENTEQAQTDKETERFQIQIDRVHYTVNVDTMTGAQLRSQGASERQSETSHSGAEFPPRWVSRWRSALLVVRGDVRVARVPVGRDTGSPPG